MLVAKRGGGVVHGIGLNRDLVGFGVFMAPGINDVWIVTLDDIAAAINEEDGSGPAAIMSRVVSGREN